MWLVIGWSVAISTESQFAIAEIILSVAVDSLGGVEWFRWRHRATNAGRSAQIINLSTMDVQKQHKVVRAVVGDDGDGGPNYTLRVRG
jgi:hypothetical protein